MNLNLAVGSLQSHYGVELDTNFDNFGLCDGDTCRHSECGCWDQMIAAVDAQLRKQIVEGTGCEMCERNSPGMPYHKASSGCLSGKRNHCTCDSCY